MYLFIPDSELDLKRQNNFIRLFLVVSLNSGYLTEKDTADYFTLYDFLMSKSMDLDWFRLHPFHY